MKVRQLISAFCAGLLLAMMAVAGCSTDNGMNTQGNSSNSSSNSRGAASYRGY